MSHAFTIPVEPCCIHLKPKMIRIACFYNLSWTMLHSSTTWDDPYCMFLQSQLSHVACIVKLRWSVLHTGTFKIWIEPCSMQLQFELSHVACFRNLSWVMLLDFTKWVQQRVIFYTTHHPWKIVLYLFCTNFLVEFMICSDNCFWGPICTVAFTVSRTSNFTSEPFALLILIFDTWRYQSVSSGTLSSVVEP